MAGRAGQGRAVYDRVRPPYHIIGITSSAPGPAGLGGDGVCVPSGNLGSIQRAERPTTHTHTTHTPHMQGCNERGGK